MVLKVIGVGSTPKPELPTMYRREQGCGWGAAPAAAAPRSGPGPESALSKNTHLRSRPESAPEETERGSSRAPLFLGRGGGWAD